MIKTYNDLIVACENFGYSKEYYEMMKEAAEIDLMNIYVANQEYMSENADYITECADVLDGYFQEATGSENVANVKKNAVGKSNNLFKRIWAKIKQIFRAIINFFRRFTGHTEQHMARINAYKDLLKIETSKIPGASEIVDKYEKKIRDLDIIVLDANGRPIKFGKPGAKSDNRIKVMQKVVTDAMGSKTLHINSLKGKIAEPDKLGSLMKAIMSDSKNAASISKNVASNSKTTIPLSTEKIKKQIEVVTNIMSEMEAAYDKGIDALAGPDANDNVSNRVALLSDAMNYAGNTLSAYTEADKLLAILADFVSEYKSFVEKNKDKEPVKTKGKAKKAQTDDDDDEIPEVFAY